ncbi:rRNA maturation RNase YbeY [Roseibium sp.]|uniref:rRNA maturation RNase YbeY n=1 Tax=Roseibium sp. TaxID=1936156 RepID=UPI003A984354
MAEQQQGAGGRFPDGFETDVAIEAGNWPDEDTLLRICDKAIRTAFEVAPLLAVDGSEVSLVFTDDASIRALNARWREKDKPTNVLSFPGSDPNGETYGPLLGDIVFAEETVSREAEEMGIEFSAHLSHLIVHGLLHLFDYDHQETDEAELMEDLERKVLAELGIADPYADQPLIADD